MLVAGIIYGHTASYASGGGALSRLPGWLLALRAVVVKPRMAVWGALRHEELMSAQPDLPNWRLYMRGGMISQREEASLEGFDRDLTGTRTDRDVSLRRGGEELASTCLSCLKALNVPGTVWYLLYTVDRLLSEDESRCAYFYRAIATNYESGEKESFVGLKPVLRLFASTSDAQDSASMQTRWRALSVLRTLFSSLDMCPASARPLLEQQQCECIKGVIACLIRESNSLPDALRDASTARRTNCEENDVLLLRVAVLQSSLELLQRLAQMPACRSTLIRLRGLEALTAAPFLCPTSAPSLLHDAPCDVQYRVVFIVWMLSYDAAVADRLRWRSPLDAAITLHSRTDPTKGVLREFVHLLASSEKTRVVRVILLVLRNFVDDSANINTNCVRHGLNQQMIDVGILAALRSVVDRVWPDPDIHTDAQHVLDTLQRDCDALSSWDQFRQDVLSRSLSWSNTCHTDPAFWKNNSKYFEKNNGAVIQALVGLLEEQLGGTASIGDLYSAEVLACACRDVGQIALAHPRGYAMLGEEAKRHCLLAAQLPDEEIRKEALLAVQQLMVASFK